MATPDSLDKQTQKTAKDIEKHIASGNESAATALAEVNDYLKTLSPDERLRQGQILFSTIAADEAQSKQIDPKTGLAILPELLLVDQKLAHQKDLSKQALEGIIVDDITSGNYAEASAAQLLLSMFAQVEKAQGRIDGKIDVDSAISVFEQTHKIVETDNGFSAILNAQGKIDAIVSPIGENIPLAANSNGSSGLIFQDGNWTYKDASGAEISVKDLQLSKDGALFTRPDGTQEQVNLNGSSMIRDSKGRIISETDTKNQVVTYEYWGDENQPFRYTDATGKQWQVDHNFPTFTYGQWFSTDGINKKAFSLDQSTGATTSTDANNITTTSHLDGTLTRIIAGGAVETLDTSGNVTQTETAGLKINYADGKIQSPVIDKLDNSTWTFNGSGWIHSDGTGKQIGTSVYDLQGYSSVAFENGNSISFTLQKDSPAGPTVKFNADGSKSVSFSDGVTEKINSQNQPVEFDTPNGDVWTPVGNSWIINSADGTRSAQIVGSVEMTLEGKIKVTQNNGLTEIITQKPDGSQSIAFSANVIAEDGKASTLQMSVDLDAKNNILSLTLPDGSTLKPNPDGTSDSWLRIAKDGSALPAVAAHIEFFGSGDIFITPPDRSGFNLLDHGSAATGDPINGMWKLPLGHDFYEKHDGNAITAIQNDVTGQRTSLTYNGVTIQPLSDAGEIQPQSIISLPDKSTITFDAKQNKWFHQFNDGRPAVEVSAPYLKDDNRLYEKSKNGSEIQVSAGNGDYSTALPNGAVEHYGNDGKLADVTFNGMTLQYKDGVLTKIVTVDNEVYEYHQPSARIDGASGYWTHEINGRPVPGEPPITSVSPLDKDPFATADGLTISFLVKPGASANAVEESKIFNSNGTETVGKDIPASITSNGDGSWTKVKSDNSFDVIAVDNSVFHFDASGKLVSVDNPSGQQSFKLDWNLDGPKGQETVCCSKYPYLSKELSNLPADARLHLDAQGNIEIEYEDNYNANYSLTLRADGSSVESKNGKVMLLGYSDGTTELFNTGSGAYNYTDRQGHLWTMQNIQVPKSDGTLNTVAQMALAYTDPKTGMTNYMSIDDVSTAGVVTKSIINPTIINDSKDNFAQTTVVSYPDGSTVTSSPYQTTTITDVHDSNLKTQKLTLPDGSSVVFDSQLKAWVTGDSYGTNNPVRTSLLRINATTDNVDISYPDHKTSAHLTYIRDIHNPGKSTPEWTLPDGKQVVFDSTSKTWVTADSYAKPVQTLAASGIMFTPDGQLMVSVPDLKSGTQLITDYALDGTTAIYNSSKQLGPDALAARESALEAALNGNQPQKVFDLLKGMTTADRIALDQLYFSKNDIHIADAINKDGSMDVKDAALAKALLVRPGDDKADDVGNMKAIMALFEYDHRAGEIALRDAFSMLTKAQIDQLDKGYPNLIAQIENDSRISDATKQALEIYFKGLDGNTRPATDAEVKLAADAGLPAPTFYTKDEVVINLVNAAILNHDDHMLAEAMRNASPDIRRLYQQPENAKALQSAFKDSPVVNDIIKYGYVNLATLVQENMHLFYYNTDAITADMLNAPADQKALFIKGFEIYHSGQLATSPADMAALDYFTKLDSKLHEAGDSIATTKWEAQLMFGDGLVANVIAAQGDSNKAMTYLENISADDIKRLNITVNGVYVYRDQLFAALSHGMSGQKLLEAEDIINRTIRAYAVSNSADPITYAQLNGKRNALDFISDNTDPKAIISALLTLNQTDLNYLHNSSLLPDNYSFDHQTDMHGKTYADALTQVIDSKLSGPAKDLALDLLRRIENKETVNSKTLTPLEQILTDIVVGANSKVLLDDMRLAMKDSAFRAYLDTDAGQKFKTDIIQQIQSMLRVVAPSADGQDSGSPSWSFWKRLGCSSRDDVSKVITDYIFDGKLPSNFPHDFLSSSDTLPLPFQLALESDSSSKINSILGATRIEREALFKMDPACLSDLLQPLSAGERQFLETVIRNHPGQFDYNTHNLDNLPITLYQSEQLRLAIMQKDLATIDQILSAQKGNPGALGGLFQTYSKEFGGDLKQDVLALVGNDRQIKDKYSNWLDAVHIVEAREYGYQAINQYALMSTGWSADMLRDGTKDAAFMSIDQLVKMLNIPNANLDQVSKAYDSAMTLVEQWGKSKEALVDNAALAFNVVSSMLAMAIPGIGEAKLAALTAGFIYGALTSLYIKQSGLGATFDKSTTNETMLMGGVGFALNFLGPDVLAQVIKSAGSLGSEIVSGASADIMRIFGKSASDAEDAMQQAIVKAVIGQGGHITPDVAQGLLVTLHIPVNDVTTAQMVKLLNKQIEENIGKLSLQIFEKGLGIAIGTAAGGGSSALDVGLYHLDTSKPLSDQIAQIANAFKQGAAAGFSGAVSFTAFMTVSGAAVGIVQAFGEGVKVTATTTLKIVHDGIVEWLKPGETKELPANAIIQTPDGAIVNALSQMALKDNGPDGNGLPAKSNSTTVDDVLAARNGGDWPMEPGPNGVALPIESTQQFTAEQLDAAWSVLEGLPYKLTHDASLPDRINEAKAMIDAWQENIREIAKAASKIQRSSLPEDVKFAQLRELAQPRIDQLQTWLNKVCDENHIPRVELAMTREANNEGSFSFTTGVINIDPNLVLGDNSMGAVKTLLHELLHSEQTALIIDRIADAVPLPKGFGLKTVIKAQYLKLFGLQLDDAYLDRVLAARTETLTEPQQAFADSLITARQQKLQALRDQAEIDTKPIYDQFYTNVKQLNQLESTDGTAPQAARAYIRDHMKELMEFFKIRARDTASWSDNDCVKYVVDYIQHQQSGLQTQLTAAQTSYASNPLEWDAQFFGYITGLMGSTNLSDQLPLSYTNQNPGDSAQAAYRQLLEALASLPKSNSNPNEQISKTTADNSYQPTDQQPGNSTKDSQPDAPITIATKYGETDVSLDQQSTQKVTDFKSIELTDGSTLKGTNAQQTSTDKIKRINFADGSFLERVDETTWRKYSKQNDTISIEKASLTYNASGELEITPITEETRLYPDGVKEIRTSGKVDYQNLNLSSERQTLTDAISASGLSDVEKSRFQQFMDSAEKRITDPTELAKTYHEVLKLFASDNEIPQPSRADRVWLAEQILMNIADPALIAQGAGNPTCTVAALEKRIATMHPGDYARLIATAGIGEPYIAQDGRIIDGGLFNVQDLDIESRLARLNRTKSIFDHNADLKADNASRDWASQIFQNFAVNLDPEGGSSLLDTKASWIWRGDNIAGGNFVLKDGQWVPAVNELGMSMTSPFVGLNGVSSIEDIYQAITGVEVTSSVEPELIVTGTTLWARMKNEKLPDRAAALVEIVNQAQEQGNLPLLLIVDTRNEPLWTDSDHGQAGGAGGRHVMVITGIDPVTGKISLQNNWGTEKDYVGARALTPQDVLGMMKLQ